jgi:hypothetical protein
MLNTFINRTDNSVETNKQTPSRYASALIRRLSNFLNLCLDTGLASLLSECHSVQHSIQSMTKLWLHKDYVAITFEITLACYTLVSSIQAAVVYHLSHKLMQVRSTVIGNYDDSDPRPHTGVSDCAICLFLQY